MHSIVKTSAFVVILCVLLIWCAITDNSPRTRQGLGYLGTDTLIVHNFQSSPTALVAPYYEEIIYFDIPNNEDSAHASSIVDISQVSDKHLMLLYFAGSREGARDVGIYQSFFSFDELDIGLNASPNTAWSEPKRILDAPLLSHLSGKFIKKLGNPVSFVDTKGRVHLFVVGVSMGGWATSKIYHLLFEQEHLRSLHYIQELHLSPFLNLSHLVRTPPVLKDNGGFILPIYHELARKYPLLLDFGESLKLDSIILPTSLTSQLQPSFVSIDKNSIFGVYRNHKSLNNVLYTSECGGSCLKAKASNLFNYDASSVLFNALDSVFLLHNQSQRAEGNKREELWLYVLLNVEDSHQVHFRALFMLDSLLGNEVSYPSVTLSGEFACVAYTYGRKYIRVAFVPKVMLNKALSTL